MSRILYQVFYAQFSSSPFQRHRNFAIDRTKSLPSISVAIRQLLSKRPRQPVGRTLVTGLRFALALA